MLKISIILIFQLLISSLSAQDLKELKIIGKAKKLETGEMVARRDGNGNYCAAIQVISNLDGFTYDSFDGIVGNIDDKPGMDIVYLTSTERVLQIFKTGFKPMKLILSDLGVVLAPREIWQIELSGNEDIGTLPVTFRLSPTDASLKIDGNLENASSTIALAPGNHKILIEKEGFQKLEKTIIIDPKNVFFELKLDRTQTQWLVVTSEPNGADVYLNNKPVGKTPYQSEMPVGTYDLRISTELYLPTNEIVELTSTGKKAINVILKPNFGSLHIISQPENGAQVSINGMSTGKMTPCLIEKIPAGECTISLILNMFETNVQKSTIMPGETKELTINMNPTFSGVTVNSNPVSDIYINGALKGKSPWKGRLNPGIYTFEARLDKYTTAAEKQTVVQGTPLEINLVPSPMTGSLKIMTQPINAEVELNGKNYGTTPITINTLLIGSYSLELSKTGFVSITKTIEITENQTTTINEDFSSHLSIDINSSPSGANVYFDDKYEGKTPLKINAGIGKHKIRLSLKPDYLDEEQEIEVSQQKKYFSLSLVQDPKSQKKMDELAAKVYRIDDKGNYQVPEGMLYKGVYQLVYINSGPAMFTPPIFYKMSYYGNRGITGSNAFINLSLLGRFMITPALLTWDMFSVGVGYLGVSSNHQNRFKLEISAGYNPQLAIKTFDYHGDEITRERKLDLLKTTSSNGDRGGTGEQLVPFDASISYERYIGGHAFFCLIAGCLWGPEMKWYKKSEVDEFIKYGEPAPIPLISGDLPASPFIEDFQPYFGIGIRF
ncbi:MAG: PEGA domain-containing protein [Bacteroidales bacterium]